MRVRIHNHLRTRDINREPSQEQKVFEGIQRLRSKYQSLHYQRVDAERNARKQDKELGKGNSQAQQAWEYAMRLAIEESNALSEYNFAVERGNQLFGRGQFSKIRVGETR